jgi:hypothetical protein
MTTVRHAFLVGSLVTAALGGYFGAPFALSNADKRPLLPARTSRGHYLIEARCNACHTPFRGVTNEACLRCHEAGLVASEDTHPESKFADPRNADRVAGLDARACVTCHREHAPERTREGGITLPRDFCVACHQDVAKDRPSHAGFAFDGCASTGCHRFHDNRGLYELFLRKHLGEPDLLATPQVLSRTTASGAPRRALEADAPGDVVERAGDVVRAWEGSAHARAGVACAPCHDRSDAGKRAVWRDRPGAEACPRCHADEAAGFAHGQHGMRSEPGLPPLTPAMARLPMRREAQGARVSCESCHGAHAYDTRAAAMSACLGCHDDRHSRAYQASRHFAAWRDELSGKAAPGSGVSCATCHLPRVSVRVGGGHVVEVEHDQNANLRPRDKMLRTVCMACHGLGFAIDALADQDLVDRNFNGRPAVHVESMAMVERRAHERGEGP